MVLIFGWGDSRSKDLGEIAPATCPNCRNDVFLHEVRSNKSFSLYFVPLGSYENNRYLVCPICRFGLKLRPEDAQAVTNQRAATNALRRGVATWDQYRVSAEQFWRRVGTGQPQQLSVPASLPTGVPGPAPRPGVRAPASQAATTGGPASPDLATQLAELGRLRADGVLTEEEFAAAKRRLLGG